MNKKNIVRIAIIVGVVLLVAAVVVLKINVKTASKIPDEPLGLTKAFDLATFRSYGVPVIIDFGADSCIPCKEMAPVLVALHDELKGKAIIRIVDVWKYRELAEGIPLQVIPTQVFFDADGKPFTPPESLGIPFTMYSNKETNEHVFTTHEGGLTKEQLLAIIDAMGMMK
jgi:thioredoxin 1